jgi:Flp pilus assembly protein protease CpaA
VRWQKPCSAFELALGALGLTVLMFVLSWMGYGNGTWPRAWGDPVTFSAALAKLPSAALFGGTTAVALFLVSGLRSNGNSARRDG